MEATIVDLRYNMKKVLQALDRGESVTVLYHGKEKAIITPIHATKDEAKVSEHSFFGMSKDSEKPVEDVMQDLRGGRYK